MPTDSSGARIEGGAGGLGCQRQPRGAPHEATDRSLRVAGRVADPEATKGRPEGAVPPPSLEEGGTGRDRRPRNNEAKYGDGAEPVRPLTDEGRSPEENPRFPTREASRRWAS